MKIKTVVIMTAVGLTLVQMNASMSPPLYGETDGGSAMSIAHNLVGSELTSAEKSENAKIKKALKAPSPITFKKERNIIEVINDVKAIITHLKGGIFNEHNKPEQNENALYPTPADRCEVLLKDTLVILFELSDALKVTAAKGEKLGSISRVRNSVAAEIHKRAEQIEDGFKKGKLEIVFVVADTILPEISGIIKDIPTIGEPVSKVLKSISSILGKCSKSKELVEELKAIDLTDLPE